MLRIRTSLQSTILFFAVFVYGSSVRAFRANRIKKLFGKVVSVLRIGGHVMAAMSASSSCDVTITMHHSLCFISFILLLSLLLIVKHCKNDFISLF